MHRALLEQGFCFQAQALKLSWSRLVTKKVHNLVSVLSSPAHVYAQVRFLQLTHALRVRKHGAQKRQQHFVVCLGRAAVSPDHGMNPVIPPVVDLPNTRNNMATRASMPAVHDVARAHSDDIAHVHHASDLGNGFESRRLVAGCAVRSTGARGVQLAAGPEGGRQGGPRKQ